VSLRQPKLFNVTNLFEWMEMILLQGKTNFFEKRVGEYALSGVGTNVTNHEFELDANFKLKLKPSSPEPRYCIIRLIHLSLPYFLVHHINIL